MGLVALNVDIASTPSFILDFHYPNGNDGSSAIPLTWRTVPAFINKPTGTPFTVNLFALYLTQPPSALAVASLASGTLSGGWALASNGDLSFDGSDVADITISVSATGYTKVATTNTFRIMSSAAASADTIAPTYPMGLTLLSQTPNSATFKVNPPMDPVTSAIAASGNKDFRVYVDGVLNTTVALSAGLSVRLAMAEFAGGTTSRRYARAAWVDMSNNQLKSSNGIIHGAGNPQKTKGPAAPNVTAIIARIYLKDLINAAGTAYTMDNGTSTLTGTATLYKIFQDLAAINAELAAETPPRPAVGLIVMPIVKTFDTPGNSTNPSPAFLASVNTHYTQNGGGYQLSRWAKLYLDAWDACIKEMGRLFGANPNFLGIATQEIAQGGITSNNYSPTAYADGIIAEHQSIFNAHSAIRGYCYFNQMQGDGNRQERQRVFTALQGMGFWIGGPDLLPLSGSLVNDPYKLYAPNSGLQGIFSALQNDSYTSPPTDTPAHTLKDYTDWAINGGGGINVPSLPNGLSGPDAFVWTYRQPSGTNPPFFFSDAIPVIATANYPPVNFSPPVDPTIPAGSLIQTGNTYAVTSYGQGILPTKDEWSPARVPITGDINIICIVDGVTGTNTAQAYGGIAIREKVGSDERVANLHLGAGRLRFEYRPTKGLGYTVVATVNGITLAAPCALWLARSGNIFTAYYSLDFNNWTLIGASPALPMTNSAYAELWCASGAATSVTMTFKQVNIQNLAQVQFTCNGLNSGIHQVALKSRDIAFNESIAGPTAGVNI